MELSKEHSNEPSCDLALLNTLRPGSALFIVGEAGMGKTYLAQNYLAQISLSGGRIETLALASSSSGQASNALARLARNERARSTERSATSVILIDDLPPTDECDLTRQAKAIRGLLNLECIVLICVRPEAVQLAEELPDIPRLDLAAAQSAHAREFDQEWPLCMGIPALYHPLAAARAKGIEGARLTQIFQRSFRTLMDKYFRSTIPAEELELRLGMVLLGQGSESDLCALVRHIDPESLAWQQSITPLFGIDSVGRTFCCTALLDSGLLGTLLPILRHSCARAPEVAYGAASMLMRRGELHRAVVVAGICTAAQCRKLVSLWGIELVCAGEVPFVRSVVGDAVGSDTLVDDGLLEARSAMALLAAPGSSLRENMVTGLKSLRSGADQAFSSMPLPLHRRHLELLQACRDLDRGTPLGVDLSWEGDEDELSLSLREHVEARSLLLKGRITQAYTLLLNNSRRIEASSLGAALLSDDFEIASVLLGEEPGDVEVRTFEQAKEFIAKLGVERLAVYRGALDQWVSVLAGRKDEIEGVEAAISLAEKMGDSAICSCLLVGASVCDVRRGLFPRAHVRALQAAELGKWASEYLGQSSLLMGGVADLCLGDEVPLRRLAEGPAKDSVAVLAQLLLQAESKEPEAASERVPISPAPDKNIAWMLNVLCNDLKDFSLRLRPSLPETWSWVSRRVARKADSFSRLVEQGVRKPRAASAGSRRPARAPRNRLKRRPIEVFVLGDFYVRVQGVAVSMPRLERRRANALIACLAAKEGHRLRRVEVIESLWPDCDFSRGLQRLYEATSHARRMLEAERLGVDPFIGNRGEGIIGLNSECVSVDVDEFVQKARRAVAEADGDRTVSLALEALDVYRGNLFVSAFDARGIQSSRRRELLDLHSDISVAAVYAALGEGNAPVATRIAAQAYERGTLREDVALAYIESLKAAGRAALAADVYRDYAKHLLSQTGMPPSAALRRAVEDIFPTKQARAAARVRKKRDEVVLSR